MKAFRWIVLVPASFIAGVAGNLFIMLMAWIADSLGMVDHVGADDIDFTISAWQIEFSSALLSSLLMVNAAKAIAPSHKRMVGVVGAIIGYIIGASLIIIWSINGQFSEDALYRIVEIAGLVLGFSTGFLGNPDEDLNH